MCSVPFLMRALQCEGEGGKKKGGNVFVWMNNLTNMKY